MKEKKIKQEKNGDKLNKKKSDAFALYNFPYYNDSRKYSWLYPVKALLACLSAAFGIEYIARLLRFEQGLFSFAAAAFIACGIYYALLGLFKTLPVTVFTVCGLALLCFEEIKRSGLAANAQSFIRQYTVVANRDLVFTSNFFDSGLSDGSVSFMILISFVFGIIFAFCTAKRFHPDIIFIISAALAVPSFVSLTASFYPSLAIFTAGLLAIWAMNQSMSANVTLASGGAINVRAADKEYRRSTKKISPSAKLLTDGKHYSRHLSDGVVIFTAVVFIMNIAASAFPKDGSIKFDKMVQKVISWGQDVGAYFGGTFTDISIMFGGKSYLNGFFAADGSNISISNSINPHAGNRKGVPVLEVTTEKKDKLYLRGDIGCDFDGDNWISISKMDFRNLKYRVNVKDLWGVGADGSNDAAYTADDEIDISDIFGNYIPEIQMLYARSLRSFTESNLEGGDTIGIETVKIDYLKNINTVLFPGTPFVYNFRENGNFKIYGDFMGISNGSNINSMETGVLYVNRPVDVHVDENYDEYVFEQLETSVSYEDYRKYIKGYEGFVNDYYKRISNECKGTISSFAQKCLENISSDYDNYEEFKKLYCDSVMDYLNSGRYKYSLTADNFSSETSSPLHTFLYNTRQGHCAMFASAMCLALRYQGIPARYVTGFTLGGDGCEQTDDGHYKYTLTDKELHAWVEVYYENLGWVPYDPTPGSIRADIGTAPSVTDITVTTPSSESAATETSPADTTENRSDTTTSAAQSGETSAALTVPTAAEGSGAAAADSEVIKLILIILGAVLVLFAAVMTVLGFYKKLGRRQRELMSFFREGDPTEAVRAMLPFMLRLLAMMKVVRNKGETPEEFGLRADRQLELTAAVEAAIPVFEKSEFDNSPVFSSDERDAAYGCIKKLLRRLLEGMKAPEQLAARIRLFGRKQKI